MDSILDLYWTAITYGKNPLYTKLYSKIDRMNAIFNENVPRSEATSVRSAWVKAVDEKSKESLREYQRQVRNWEKRTNREKHHPPQKPRGKEPKEILQ